GDFTNAAGIPQADYVARWNGSSWSALGGGGNGALSGPVFALAVSGGDVYAGGNFTNAAGIAEADRVARWDGSAWSNLGGSVVAALNGDASVLAVSGGNLYVGGGFTNAGGVPEADYVARWNGSAWSALGGSGGNSALSSPVLALAVSGSDVYVGGWFTNAAGIAEADYVARWDGTNWNALGGSGNGALNSWVNALAASGGDVYVGGAFTNAAGIPQADYVARWDGTNWNALGGGANGALNSQVYALAVSGGDVYVGGDFTNAAGIPQADYVARWNGSSWSALGGGGNGALSGPVFALAVSGGDVYAGGNFTNAAGIAEADRVARWDGSAWSNLGGSVVAALNGDASVLAVSGGNLYVGGGFTNAGGVPEADYVARWNGSAWSALGGSGGNSALSSPVLALAVSGSDVYVGGWFTNAAGIAEADYVARWNGTSWSALGGSGNGALNSWVNALAASGGDVYVGGAFTNAAGIPQADYVARWDGTNWNALGGGANGALNSQVYALAVSGGDVYVGGDFTNAAGIPQADYVARWNGSSWSALGGGANGALNGQVYALAVNGNDLYVGGNFIDAAGIPQADYVARWNGSAWSALGSSADGDLNGQVKALAVSGSDVYVGGQFTDAAGISQADHVARWDGSAWSALGGSGGNGALTGQVKALAVSGSDVYVGGFFWDAAGNQLADNIAAYAAPPSVSAITRLDPNPTSAASVQFQVTFDEPVTGVAASDFALATTGNLSGASISGVSGSGATYTVTVATGTGDGALRLDVPAGATINDLAGVGVNNAPFVTGESYTVDKTAPAVTAITRLDPNPTSAASVQFQATFSEPVTGVAANDFTLTTTGSLSGASVTGVSGSGATYVVTVATGTGNGTLRLDVPAGATIADQVGFSLSNLPFTSGQAYTVNSGGGSPTPTPTPPGGSPTPTPTPPGGSPTPTPTPPGGGTQVRVYLPLAQR
ncbi:MAG: hypothetical protein RMK84_14800, partial [Oscillochloridaceae bacterium]|nr:hypothetical protein [Oscillochloridaceae bacterium]